MVEGAARLAFPHQHAGHPEEPRAAHQFVAGHARAALDKPGPDESASDVVHSGRTSDLAATAAVAHGNHREPQEQYSAGAGLLKTKRVGITQAARSADDEGGALDKTHPATNGARTCEIEY